VGYEVRDYWIQAFLRSGSQASSGTRVVAVVDRFVEMPSIHHQAWQVALVADPLDIMSEIESDESWSIDCKSCSVSLQNSGCISKQTTNALNPRHDFFYQISWCNIIMLSEHLG
jgi:hypothetical protein